MVPVPLWPNRWSSYRGYPYALANISVPHSSRRRFLLFFLLLFLDYFHFGNFLLLHRGNFSGECLQMLMRRFVVALRCRRFRLRIEFGK